MQLCSLAVGMGIWQTWNKTRNIKKVLWGNGKQGIRRGKLAFSSFLFSRLLAQMNFNLSWKIIIFKKIISNLSYGKNINKPIFIQKMGLYSSFFFQLFNCHSSQKPHIWDTLCQILQTNGLCSLPSWCKQGDKCCLRSLQVLLIFYTLETMCMFKIRKVNVELIKREVSDKEVLLILELTFQGGCVILHDT